MPTRSPSITLTLPPTEGEESAPSAAELLGEFQHLGLLGEGGMGQVYRVRDPGLRRTMALKVLHAGMGDDEAVLARFIEEAQVSAQLQHPGIVPVHGLGRLPDGRWYFTMKEVEGRTLRDVVAELHDAAKRGVAAPGAWTSRRLIDAFHKICEAVAYAHSKGVLHRDIKPQNIMLGQFGEVLLLDWGLAKLLRGKGTVAGETIQTARSESDVHATRMGRVSGTPAYMAPEQAMGDTDQITRASDVYGLGAVLFEILTGSPPFRGSSVRDVLAAVRSGQRIPWGGVLPIPDPLRAVCDVAMSTDAGGRYRDAGELAAEVSAWLDGARRVDQAREIVHSADEKMASLASLRQRATLLRGEAERRLRTVRTYEPIEAKRPGWALEDEADGLETEAEHQELSGLQDIRSALNLVPNLPEAHDRLATHYRARHADAERRRDARASDSFGILLAAHDVSGKQAEYLQGDGRFTLLTDPPGALVELHRYTLKDRRLVSSAPRILGRTPLLDRVLPMGSYLVVVTAEGRLPVRYPVHISRQSHWDGVPPGGTEPLPIVLPRPGELGDDDIYVPAGWYVRGGDPLAVNGKPWARVWVDGFIVRRFPVTSAEYLVFLNDLVAHDRGKDARKWAPQEGSAGELRREGTLLVGEDAEGRFFLTRDAEGDLWLPDIPITMIDYYSADAYVRWAAERDGVPWQLPREDQWEKAARGVDGRFFPWGDFFDSTWCCVLSSHREQPAPALVTDFPIDESPYGVRGMAGNVRDWCLDLHVPGETGVEEQEVLHQGGTAGEPKDRILRGGGWCYGASMARLAHRNVGRETERFSLHGMRLVRPASWALRR